MHSLTNSKIEKFFHSEGGEETMKYAGKLYEKALNDISEDFLYRFREYLVDEYSVFHNGIIRDLVTKEVTSLLLGDEKVLEKYNLAPADWGLRCDPYSIRRKIVENNKDIIGSTYIQSLEEQVARLQSDLEFHRKGGW